MNAITVIANGHCQLSNCPDTPIFRACYTVNTRAQFPLQIFFVALRPCLEKTGLFSEWVLVLWSKHFQNYGPQWFWVDFSPFYCVLNLTPCRYCIFVKFLLLFVRQDLGLFISPGAGISWSWQCCTLQKYFSSFQQISMILWPHQDKKLWRHQKSRCCCSTVSQFLQHDKEFQSVTFCDISLFMGQTTIF